MDQNTLQTIEAIEKGDRKKAQEFFKPLIPEIFHYTELYLSGEDQIQDCVRKVINTAYKNISGARKEASLTDWIKDQALEVIVEEIGPVAVRRGSGKSHGEPTRKAVPEDLAECRKELLEQLSNLDLCERAAVVLNQYEHCSVMKTATLLHTDPEIVDTLLRHGRSRLDALYLFELVEKLNPRELIDDTMEIDMFLPERKDATDTYQFTNSIRTVDDLFIEQTKTMKPIRQRKERTYEDGSEGGPSQLLLRILLFLLILAACVLVWFLVSTYLL